MPRDTSRRTGDRPPPGRARPCACPAPPPTARSRRCSWRSRAAGRASGAAPVPSARRRSDNAHPDASAAGWSSPPGSPRAPPGTSRACALGRSRDSRPRRVTRRGPRRARAGRRSDGRACRSRRSGGAASRGAAGRRAVPGGSAGSAAPPRPGTPTGMAPCRVAWRGARPGDRRRSRPRPRPRAA